MLLTGYNLQEKKSNFRNNYSKLLVLPKLYKKNNKYEGSIRVNLWEKVCENAVSKKAIDSSINIFI